MRYIDEESLKVMKENQRLEKISDEKYQIWEAAANKALKISLAEYDKTRP